MEYRKISRTLAVWFLKNSKNGIEPVWFKTNNTTDKVAHCIDTIDVNGKRVEVYSSVDAGKVYFKFDNGNKVDIHGFEECKYAYILESDYNIIEDIILTSNDDGDTISYKDFVKHFRRMYKMSKDNWAREMGSVENCLKAWYI